MIEHHLLLSRIRMLLIELPRALEDYFAFAEIEPTRRGRRFSITLPYHKGDSVERLQWWYHVSPSQEQMYDGHGIVVFRERAVRSFCRHIERWLGITNQRLHGDEPIPRISAVPRIVSTPAPAAAEPAPTENAVSEWPVEKIANG